jgi:Glycosyl transferases group 1
MSPLIVLTAPPGDFYAYVLRCFADGFEAAGAACLTVNPPPDIATLAQWASKYRPAAVVEINRVLANEANWPSGVPHAAWLQDHRFNGDDLTRDLGKSHQLYFIVHPDSFGVALPQGRSWSILVPGARADAAAAADLAIERDFSVTGFIPVPLDDHSPVSYMPDGRPVQLADFLRGFPTRVLSDASFSMRAIHDCIAQRCAELGCRPIVDRGTVGVFDEILVRTLERRQIIEALLATGGTLEIFGPATWEKWPQFAPHYRGHVDDPRQLDRIFQTTRVNLHNSGLTMHFRVMDCLAAGAFMLINETPWDTLRGGIRHYLEPSRHYGAYEIAEVGEVAARYLHDEAARQRIAAEGRRIVLAEHTWRHRALQIMRDLDLASGATARAPTAALEEARQALELLAARSGNELAAARAAG